MVITRSSSSLSFHICDSKLQCCTKMEVKIQILHILCIALSAIRSNISMTQEMIFFLFCIEHIDVTFPGIKNTRETIQCTCALWLSTQSGLGCIIQTCLTLRPYGSTVKHEKGPRNFRCLPSCQVHGPNIFFQEKHLPTIMSRLVEF